MLKHIKNLLVNMISGAAVITAVLLLLVGFSDRINPSAHPLAGSLGMLFPFFLLANLLMLLTMLAVRWRRAWIPLAGFALAYVPIRTFLPINIPQDAPEGAIKVVSYNVCAFTGLEQFDLPVDTIMSCLKQMDADILCLQEDMEGLRGKPQERLKELYPYNDTVHISKRSKYINAIGIHTRYPIIKKERIDYASNANGSVAYYLLVGGDTVIVVNNHLENTHLTKDDRLRYKEMIKELANRQVNDEEAHQLFGILNEASAIRALQADAVHRFIIDHDQYPLIVCGDFNDTPISYARHTIAEGLTDCFVTCGLGLGLSYNQKGFNFRIDHLMCSRHFVPYGCIIDNKIDVSDHYPVICWLKKVDNS